MLPLHLPSSVQSKQNKKNNPLISGNVLPLVPLVPPLQLHPVEDRHTQSNDKENCSIWQRWLEQGHQTFQRNTTQLTFSPFLPNTSVKDPLAAMTAPGSPFSPCNYQSYFTVFKKLFSANQEKSEQRYCCLKHDRLVMLWYQM